MKIVKIVTHHKKPERAAELYAEEGVMAVGFDIGDPTGKSREELKELFVEEWGLSEAKAASATGSLLRFRDEISIGDLVFAYAKKNKVALVGEILGDHKYNTRNKVGDPDGEIRYPNQRKVKWWNRPRNFDRSYLPDDVSKKVALTGTIHIFEYDSDKLKKSLDQISGIKAEKLIDKATFYLKEFNEWPGKEEGYRSKLERENWYRHLLNKNTVDTIPAKDIDEIFGELWTVILFHKRSLTEFGDIDKSRKTLKYLLFGKEKLVERIRNVLEGEFKLKYFGLDRVSELLHIYNGNLPLLSKRTRWSADHLEMAPKYEKGSVSDEYEKYRQVFNSIRDRCNLRDLREVDVFLNFIYEYEKLTGKKRPFPLEVMEGAPTFFTEFKKAVFTHLIAGRNIVFYGPPGTGKTRKAVDIAKEFCGKITNPQGEDLPNFTFETANAEWTAYDVVGGPTISGARMLKFKPGFLTLAARKCEESLEKQAFPHWLIIDEINRANLDLAFGKVFSLLDLEYRDHPLLDESELKNLENGEEYRNLKIPINFRILATMNTYDRAILFSLGYAFRRRFAFVEVASPFTEKVEETYEAKEGTWKAEISVIEEERFKEFVEEIKMWIQKKAFLQLPEDFKSRIGQPESFDLGDRLRTLCDDIEEGKLEPFNPFRLAYKLAEHVTKLEIVEIGYAQPVDVVKYALVYVTLFLGDNQKTAMVKALDEAVRAYFIPHLEYYLPKARRKMTIGGKKEEEEVKEKLEDLRRLFGTLGLRKSEQKVQETIKKLEIGETSIL